jgi:hypothetical protein
MKRLVKISPRCIRFFSDYSIETIRSLIKKGYIYHCSRKFMLRGFGEYVVATDPSILFIVDSNDKNLISNLAL